MDDLYREELLDIYKNPRNKGKMKDATVSSDKRNKMCGDEINLQLKVKNGVVEDAKFDGSACAVSVISSEMLIEQIIGKKVEDLLKIDKDKFLKDLNLNLTTSRVKCATLVLDALKGALEIYEPEN